MKKLFELFVMRENVECLPLNILTKNFGLKLCSQSSILKQVLSEVDVKIII